MTPFITVPHLPDGKDPQLTKICQCRKPATGMIDLAYKEIANLSKKNSFMVGDKEADIGLAMNANIHSIIVRTGYGEETLKSLQARNIQPDFVALDISEAV